MHANDLERDASAVEPPHNPQPYDDCNRAWLIARSVTDPVNRLAMLTPCSQTCEHGAGSDSTKAGLPTEELRANLD